MTSSSNLLNFNNLPPEVRRLTFDLLNPTELALASPTCERWHQIIMETKAWWRDIKVEENASFVVIMTMLRLFTAKSQNIITRIKIHRKIEKDSHLQQIFSAIKPNSSTIKTFFIRQDREFNIQTRHFAQTLPNLRSLSSTESTHNLFDEFLISEITHGLQNLFTYNLTNIQDELGWITHLRSFQASGIYSKEAFYSILSVSENTLMYFSLTKIRSKHSPRVTPSQIPTMRELVTLKLPIKPYRQPAILLNIAAPNLMSLRCRLAQIEGIKTPPPEELEICLENGGEVGWNAVKGGKFLAQLKAVLSSQSSLKRLYIETPNSNCQVQTKALSGELLCSDQDDSLLSPIPALLSFHWPIQDTSDLGPRQLSVEKYTGK